MALTLTWERFRWVVSTPLGAAVCRGQVPTRYRETERREKEHTRGQQCVRYSKWKSKERRTVPLL